MLQLHIMQNTTSSHNDYVRIWTEYFDHKVFLWGQGAKETQYSQLFISLSLGFVINLAPFYSVWNSGVFTYKSAVDWPSVPKKCHLPKELLLRLPPCFLLFPFNWRKYKHGCSGPLPSPSATSLGSLFLEWPTWWYNYTLSWTTGLIFANCWSWYPRPEQETRSWTPTTHFHKPPMDWGRCKLETIHYCLPNTRMSNAHCSHFRHRFPSSMSPS